MLRMLIAAAAVLGLSGQMAAALTFDTPERQTLTIEESIVPLWAIGTIEKGEWVGRNICVPFLAKIGISEFVSVQDCLMTLSAMNPGKNLNQVTPGDTLAVPAPENVPAEIQSRLKTRLADKSLADNPLGMAVAIRGLQDSLAALTKSQLTKGVVRTIVKEQVTGMSLATKTDLTTLKTELLAGVSTLVTDQPEPLVATKPSTIVAGKLVPGVAAATRVQSWFDLLQRPPVWVQTIVLLLILATVCVFAWFFRRAVMSLDGRVMNHDDRLDVVEDEITRWKDISMPDGLVSTLLGLRVGELHQADIRVNDEIYTVTFAGSDARANGAMVVIAGGVKDQTQPVLIANVSTILKRAVRQGRLTIQKTPPVQLAA